MNDTTPTTKPDYTAKKIKGLFIILLAITITLGANVAMLAHERQSATPSVGAPTPTESSTPSFTMAEVLSRNTSEDCLVAAYGNVYDITQYIATGRHPGGQNTLTSGCGQDITDSFDRSHSSRARDQLEDFLIGTLATD